MLFEAINTILHIDKYLEIAVNEYASLAYLLLFLIIFLETGIVITPFLPGDSLIFAAGALAATGSLRIEILFLTLFIAAISGDTLNYHIGKFIGPKVFRRESSFLFHKSHLLRAQTFYEKYGKKTIILARFVPIVRTFAPFVAGIGKMNYGIFLMYNVIGGALWSGLFVFGGYLFGGIPWIKNNFGLFVLVIILTSLIPILKELVVHLLKKEKNI